MQCFSPWLILTHWQEDNWEITTKEWVKWEARKEMDTSFRVLASHVLFPQYMDRLIVTWENRGGRGQQGGGRVPPIGQTNTLHSLLTSDNEKKTKKQSIWYSSTSHFANSSLTSSGYAWKSVSVDYSESRAAPTMNNNPNQICIFKRHQIFTFQIITSRRPQMISPFILYRRQDRKKTCDNNVRGFNWRYCTWPVISMHTKCWLCLSHMPSHNRSHKVGLQKRKRLIPFKFDFCSYVLFA